MNEQQINHLAPYLPYRLPCVTHKYKTNPQPSLDEQLKDGPVKYLEAIDLNTRTATISSEGGWTTNCAIKIVMPILRSIKTLPADRIVCEELKWAGVHVDFERLDKDGSLKVFVKDLAEVMDAHSFFKMYEILCKNHFDIFGLIGANLAYEKP